MGDDLASDNEGWIADVKASDDDDESNDDADASPLPVIDNKAVGKRKAETVTDDADVKPERKKKRQSRDKLLLEAGRSIEEQSAQEQAAFLSTALQHYTLSSSSSSSSFNSTRQDSSSQMPFRPDYFTTSSKRSLLECIKDAVSLKKLKKWKTIGSPCVVVVCMSARRAVAILKELSALKVRAAKLFPKNGSVDDQKMQLNSNAFGLAVATPHRLLALRSRKNDQDPALNFGRTQLVVLDSALSNKQFTVATLPDTAPHCMALLREHVLLELQLRKDIKLAFF